MLSQPMATTIEIKHSADKSLQTKIILQPRNIMKLFVHQSEPIKKGITYRHAPSPIARFIVMIKVGQLKDCCRINAMARCKR